MDSAPALATSRIPEAAIAVTEIRSPDPVLGLTETVRTEDAFLLCVLVEDLIDHEVWEDGQPQPKRTIRAGEFVIRDLKRPQAALIDRPHHSLQVYLPRPALDALASEASAMPLDEISYQPGVPVSDPIIRSLCRSLLPALSEPGRANQLFVDHVLLAMGLHFLTRFGDGKMPSIARRGGLAGWQERRAKEMLGQDLSGATSLAMVARECGLSVQQFSRSFKKSLGLAPHRWLIARRIEAAKTYLTNPCLSLADIAQLCGFSDQSHLTRVFRWHTGVTPAVWRRSS